MPDPEEVLRAAVEWRDARHALKALLKSPGYPDDFERAKASDRVRDAIRNLDAVLE